MSRRVFIADLRNVINSGSSTIRRKVTDGVFAPAGRSSAKRRGRAVALEIFGQSNHPAILFNQHYAFAVTFDARGALRHRSTLDPVCQS